MSNGEELQHKCLLPVSGNPVLSVHGSHEVGKVMEALSWAQVSQVLHAHVLCWLGLAIKPVFSKISSSIHNLLNYLCSSWKRAAPCCSAHLYLVTCWTYCIFNPGGKKRIHWKIKNDWRTITIQTEREKKKRIDMRDNPGGEIEKKDQKGGDEDWRYHWPNLSHPGLASASPPIIMKAGPPSYVHFRLINTEIFQRKQPGRIQGSPSIADSRSDRRWQWSDPVTDETNQNVVAITIMENPPDFVNAPGQTTSLGGRPPLLAEQDDAWSDL